MTTRPGDSLLESNLSALRLLLGDDLAELLRGTVPADGLELIATPSGNPTWRAGGMLIYSRHDPFREARRLIEREVPNTTSLCIFENFGLGYHIEAFLELRPTARAIVVEPDIRWFRSALEARELAPVLRSERVTFVLASPAEMLHPIVGEASGVQVVRIRSLAEKDRAYFQTLSEELRSISTRKDVNKNTLARFGKRWVRNLVRNIDLVPRAGAIRSLEGRFSGIPAIVLAAGPSLDEILPHLPMLRERFLLIAVDTSYRAALDANVVPDFLVVVDPQYWNARHLDGCRLESTLLVSESSTYPSVFHRRAGGLYFCGSLFPLGQYLERRFGEKGILGAGGSVSTTTWDFARLLGCSPLYCAGLDLGFPSLKTHFSGALFEERMHTLSNRSNPAATQAFHLLRDGSPYPVVNNAGELTLTDRRLVVYKWWFETQLKMHPEATTYNLAKRGVRIEGMGYANVDKLLDGPLRRADIDSRIAEARARAIDSAASKENDSRLRAAIRDLLDGLFTIKRAADEGLDAVQELSTLFETGGETRSVLSHLDAVDRSISEGSTRDIVGFLVHSTAHEILERRVDDDAASMARGQAIQDSRELYTRLAEAADYHIGLLSVAARRFENRKITNESR